MHDKFYYFINCWKRYSFYQIRNSVFQSKFYERFLMRFGALIYQINLVNIWSRFSEKQNFKIQNKFYFKNFILRFRLYFSMYNHLSLSFVALAHEHFV